MENRKEKRRERKEEIFSAFLEVILSNCVSIIILCCFHCVCVCVCVLDYSKEWLAE